MSVFRVPFNLQTTLRAVIINTSIEPLACRVDESKDALELKELLATKGIMVRHYTKPASIAGCIRVSVGKPEQTDAVRKALAAC